MGRDVEYRIVSYDSPEETSQEVNRLIGDSQAMVRREYSEYDAADYHVYLTIEELDGIKYAIESIGEAIQDVVGAMGHMAAGLSDNPTKSTKPTTAPKAPAKSTKRRK
jgi:hypothetical protein